MFVQARRHLLGRLVAHLDTASIFEILIRLTGAEEQTGMYLPPSQVRQLPDTVPRCERLCRYATCSVVLVLCCADQVNGQRRSGKTPADPAQTLHLQCMGSHRRIHHQVLAGWHRFAMIDQLQPMPRHYPAGAVAHGN